MSKHNNDVINRGQPDFDEDYWEDLEDEGLPDRPDPARELIVIGGQVLDKNKAQGILDAIKARPDLLDYIIRGEADRLPDLPDPFVDALNNKKILPGGLLLILVAVLIFVLGAGLFVGQFIINDGWQFFELMVWDLFN